jgi:hypothetical protein
MATTAIAEKSCLYIDVSDRKNHLNEASRESVGAKQTNEAEALLREAHLRTTWMMPVLVLIFTKEILADRPCIVCKRE